MLTRANRRPAAVGSLLAAGLVTGLVGGLGVVATLDAPQAWGATSPPAPPTCPPGRTMTTLVTPSVPAAAARPSPGSTALPDGGRARTICLGPMAPAQSAPSVAPGETVGGAALARSGVVVDLPAGVPAPPDMPFGSYVVADLDTGEILAARNAHAWMLPASTLKTLTALVVIPALAPGLVVTGAQEDTLADGTRVGIVAGQPYTVDDLLDALLLSSANDAAYALARAYGGRDKLLAAMATQAERLGAFDTVALDPSGLDVEGQHSSAYDLALIGRAALRLSDFQRRVVLPTATFPGGMVTPTATTGPRTPTQGPPFQIANHNSLLGVYPGIIGVKNGYTSKALETYIVAAERGGRRLIVAEMGGPERQALNTPALLDWGFAYAGRARPVGRLVEPGTALRPTALGGTASTGGSTDTSTEEPTLEVEPATSSTPAVAATSAGPTPVERVLAAWWGGLPDLARWGLAALVVALAIGLGLLVRARARSRPRGTYER